MKKNKVKIVVALVFVLLVLNSCATLFGGSKISEENSTFLSEAKVSNGTLIRCLYSFYMIYDEEYYKDFVDAYLDGSVYLFIDQNQQEKATFNYDVGIWKITFNTDFLEYDNSSRWMYITLIIASIAQISEEGLTNENIVKDRFFNSLEKWDSDFKSLRNESWFMNKELELNVNLIN